MAVCGLLGITQPRPHRCDEIEPTLQPAQPTRLASSCTLAQPNVLLHSLVGSYPTVSTLTMNFVEIQAGLFSVAVVVKHICRQTNN